ncbi:hypothetical protein SAMN06269301_1311 [Geobacter sp. DSM 9736]|nr:hypothetical protein SAMN06269301_1311 [Geobacter sp. DSM 9736]
MHLIHSCGNPMFYFHIRGPFKKPSLCSHNLYCTKYCTANAKMG